MKFIYVKDYNELSDVASQIMVDELKNKSEINICLASGGSPELTYQMFVKKVKENNIESKDMYITKLDEWVGIDSTSDLSCEKYLRDNLVDPLNLSDHFISFLPDGNPEDEVRKVNKCLDIRPIDLCILGLGKNGHLGLNEPNTYLHPSAHIAELSEKTKTHPMIFNKNSNITQGMSIGMKDILDSKHVLLLVSGTDKEEIYDGFMKQEVTTNLPATFLWLHDNVTVIVRTDQYPQ